MKKNRYSTFKAIADPTRREILYLLVAATSALSINAISENFDSTRQAITKHIFLLERAGLLKVRKQGREKYCFADPAPLKEVHDWISQYERFWESKLDDLGRYLDFPDKI